MKLEITDLRIYVSYIFVYQRNMCSDLKSLILPSRKALKGNNGYVLLMSVITLYKSRMSYSSSNWIIKVLYHRIRCMNYEIPRYIVRERMKSDYFLI